MREPMLSHLSALYYPFSRCKHPASLKQMLLVFDSITFVDPVDDESWRAQLFADLEHFNPQFSSYRDVVSALPDLSRLGCVKRIDPGLTISQRHLASAAALGDLGDPAWLRDASNPYPHGLPAIDFDGSPSWQAFKPKLPDRFVEAISEKPEFAGHLLRRGSFGSSWSLSYAAGSAISINLHLDIAQELSLAPVTDSALHHRLVLRKAARSLGGASQASAIPDEVVQALTRNLVTTLLGSVLPRPVLDQVSFEELIRFREDTGPLRREFVRDIELRLGQLRTSPCPNEWVAAVRQVQAGIETDLRRFEADYFGARAKRWPNLLRSLNAPLGGLGAAALSLFLVPDIKGILLAAATTAAAAAAGYLDAEVERTKALKSAPPSVTYLSRIATDLPGAPNAGEIVLP